MKWEFLYENKKKTCLIDVPFKSTPNINVMMAVENATEYDVCQRAATNLVDSKFFFWSPNINPLGKQHTSNCYVFKFCSETNSTILMFAGSTYRRIEHHVKECKLPSLGRIINIPVPINSRGNYGMGCKQLVCNR